MIIVDWKGDLPLGAKVLYSSLCLPDDRDEINPDVAEIKLKTGFFIDVSWDDSEKQYWITVFREEFMSPKLQKSASTPEDVIKDVSVLAREYSDEAAFLSDTGNTMSDNVSFSSSMNPRHPDPFRFSTASPQPA